MARHVTVAAVHFTINETGPRASLDDALDQWRDAEARLDDTGIDLIVACEGMEARMVEPEELARPGRILEAYVATARRNRCTVVGSVLLRESEQTANAQVVIGPDGTVLGTYRKSFPTIGELDDGLTRGAGPVVVDTPAGRIGGVICFDLNFPELRQGYARLAPDIIAFSSMYHGGLVQSTWAYETRAFLVGACKDALSEIRDPFGRIIASATGYTRCAVARINLDRLLVHLDGNMDHFPAIRRRYREAVRIDVLADLGMAMVSCESPNLDVAKLRTEFPLVPVDTYLDAARRHRR